VCDKLYYPDLYSFIVFGFEVHNFIKYYQSACISLVSIVFLHSPVNSPAPFDCTVGMSFDIDKSIHDIVQTVRYRCEFSVSIYRLIHLLFVKKEYFRFKI
jgi:hypothetical protein